MDTPQLQYQINNSHKPKWYHTIVPWKTVAMVVIGVLAFRLGIMIGNATPHRSADGTVTAGFAYRVQQIIPGVARHGNGGCSISGCAGYSCVSADSPEAQNPTCNMGVKSQNGTCFDFAICERQPGGNCDWTETPAYFQCSQKSIEKDTIDLNQDVREVY